jgi:two-component system cell cycle sensor histidine kinase/response regulator CckA
VRDGLHATRCLPIQLGDRVIGVVEFFNREPRVPDEAVLAAEAAATSQIGQFIDRARAVEALKASEQRFREIAENVREVFFVADPETGRALYVNPAYETVFGHSREHAYSIPMAWTEGIHPDDRDRLTVAPQLSAYGVVPSDDVFRLVRPDGAIRWIRGRATPVKDAAGKVVRVVGIAEDITDLKRTEEQLFGAQKMEAIGRLAGGIAHDFNNLLTAIMGNAEMVLAELSAADPVRQDVEEIRKAGQRASTLTRQLLAFSRQQVLAPRVLDLNELVLNMDKLLRRLIGEDVELHTSLAPDLGAVRADPGQMEQVLMNLAVNARDAMPDGGQLTLETANVVLDEGYVDRHSPVPRGAYVMVAITDTGTGMTDDVKARIFEPFFTTKEAGKGTGLGLATVYGIIKQSDGYIWPYSEPGRGTTFKVYLPLVHEVAESLAVVGRVPESRGGTETVLLVEDDEAVRSLARRALVKCGYRVLEATNAGEALLAAEQHAGPIHLMVSDIVMPGLNGPELAARLRPSRAEMRVLFMSGYAERAVEQQNSVSGSAFLTKPFTPELIARKVRDVLDGGPAVSPHATGE